MHNLDENQVLRDALAGLNDEVPPMPEGLHASWMQKVEDDMTAKRIEQTRTRKSYTRFLSIAAAMVFVVGGTLLTREDLAGHVNENQIGQSSAYGVALANSANYDSVVEENDQLSIHAATEPELRVALAMTTGADAGAGNMKARSVQDEKKIIRTASMTIATQTFDDSLASLKAACEGQGGWIESISESLNSYSNLRTAYLTLRIPQHALDAYLDATTDLGRITARSESAEDVTAAYQDTQARLDTQLALMARLQALITESADLSDLLALESQIADTQYQIDSLQRSLNQTDREVSYSTVNITLREENTAPLTETGVSFGDRLLSAIQVGLEALVSFAGDAVVFLVAALPFIAIVAVAFAVVKIIRKRRK